MDEEGMPFECVGCTMRGHTEVYQVNGNAEKMAICKAREWPLRHWLKLIAGEKCPKRRLREAIKAALEDLSEA